jgi:hypothetical protein
MPAHDLASLRTVRTDLHGCFPRRADALFEFVDALLTAESVDSLPHLSVQAPHRRGWGSLDDALAVGRSEVAALRGFLRRHAAHDGPPGYAVGLSVWPRCDAAASPERGFYSHPSRHCPHQGDHRGLGERATDNQDAIDAVHCTSPVLRGTALPNRGLPGDEGQHRRPIGHPHQQRHRQRHPDSTCQDQCLRHHVLGRLLTTSVGSGTSPALPKIGESFCTMGCEEGGFRG